MAKRVWKEMGERTPPCECDWVGWMEAMAREVAVSEMVREISCLSFAWGLQPDVSPEV
jgi:hypothetical protein